MDLVPSLAMKMEQISLNHYGNLNEKILNKENMRIILNSIFVKDQDKALSFYTENLGFVKKHDVPIGEFR